MAFNVNIPPQIKIATPPKSKGIAKAFKVGWLIATRIKVICKIVEKHDRTAPATAEPIKFGISRERCPIALIVAMLEMPETKCR